MTACCKVLTSSFKTPAPRWKQAWKKTVVAAAQKSLRNKTQLYPINSDKKVGETNKQTSKNRQNLQHLIEKQTKVFLQWWKTPSWFSLEGGCWDDFADEVATNGGRNCHNTQKPSADLAHAPTRTHADAEHRSQGSQQYLSQTVSVKGLGVCELSLGAGLAPIPRACCTHPPAAPAPGLHPSKCSESKSPCAWKAWVKVDHRARRLLFTSRSAALIHAIKKKLVLKKK